MGLFTSKVTCPDCNGTGYIINTYNCEYLATRSGCTRCGGKGDDVFGDYSPLFHLTYDTLDVGGGIQHRGKWRGDAKKGSGRVKP